MKTVCGKLDIVEKVLRAKCLLEIKDLSFEDLRAAVKDILENKRCSYSLVQKSMGWGHDRTEAVLKNFERIGIVSPKTENKNDRDILIEKYAEYEKIETAIKN